jgi:hypothetical protein
MRKTTLKIRRRSLTRAEIDRLNESGYQINCIVDNQLHTDHRDDVVKTKQARRRTTTTGLMARTRTTVER